MRRPYSNISSNEQVNPVDNASRMCLLAERQLHERLEYLQVLWEMVMYGTWDHVALQRLGLLANELHADTCACDYPDLEVPVARISSSLAVAIGVPEEVGRAMLDANVAYLHEALDCASPVRKETDDCAIGRLV